MGYLHHWRQPLTISDAAWQSIRSDFRKAFTAAERCGRCSCRWLGRGAAGEISNRSICFNGPRKCGHPASGELRIPYPPKMLKESVLPAEIPTTPDGTPHGSKTGFRPYDIAMTAVLLIAKHYLRDRILVYTDGADAQWADARRICQRVLGYGACGRTQYAEHELGVTLSRQHRNRAYPLSRIGSHRSPP